MTTEKKHKKVAHLRKDECEKIIGRLTLQNETDSVYFKHVSERLKNVLKQQINIVVPVRARS